MSKKQKKEQHQLVIIGAGPGGYHAAFLAADLGMQVTLVDPEINPGGVCLYRGCIPSKALLHLAKIRAETEEAGQWGMKFNKPSIDIDKVREWKNSVVKKLTGGLGQLAKSRKVNYVRGKAKFIGSSELEVDPHNGESYSIEFKNAIVATGASPISLPGVDMSSDKVMNSEEALNISEVPKSLLVIGGGYIGLEMSSVYKALGSKVTIAEMTSDFLPGIDRELVKTFKKINNNLFKDIFLETKVEALKKDGEKIKAVLNPHEGKKVTKSFDKVLVSIGQKPNTENIGLKNTSIKTDEKRFIKVDEQQRTKEKHIFAIGDVVGGMMLAHKASYEGRVAVEAIDGKKAAFDARAVPAVVYTHPEIAYTGITEDKAKETNKKINVTKFPWSASGRALTMGADGLTKLIFEEDSDVLVGAAVVGDNAGELIAELTHAVEMASNAMDLSLTIHPHPTLSETIMEAAEMIYGHATHIHKRKRTKKK